MHPAFARTMLSFGSAMSAVDAENLNDE